MRRVTMMTTLVMFAAALTMAVSPGSEVVVTAAISAEGSGGSFWLMDLFLDNPNGTAIQVDIHWLERNADSSGSSPTTVTVPAGGSLVLEDVVGQTLGIQGAGALRLRSNGMFVATSRFVNTVSQAGQGFEGLGYGERVESGETARIAGLRQSASARSNIFAVAGPDGATYQIDLFDSSGSSVGSTTKSLPAWAAGFDSLSGLVGGFSGDMRALISVSQGTAWFAGSRVDGADSITLPAFRSASLMDPSDFAGSYTGQWTNTFFGSTGAASIDITTDLKTRQATMTIDLDGNVFGGSDPPAETFSGSMDSRGLQLTSDSSTTFGDVTFRVGPDGKISGFSASIPNPSIDSVRYHGEIADGQITLQSIINFASGPPVQSILELSR